MAGKHLLSVFAIECRVVRVLGDDSGVRVEAIVGGGFVPGASGNARSIRCGIPVSNGSSPGPGCFADGLGASCCACSLVPVLELLVNI